MITLSLAMTKAPFGLGEPEKREHWDERSDLPAAAEAKGMPSTRTRP